MPGATQSQIDEFLTIQTETATPETAVRLRRVIDRFSVGGLLDRVQAATLVLHAVADTIHTLAQGQQLAARIPGARFVWLDSRNHIPLPQEPSWMVMMDEIDRFLMS